MMHLDEYGVQILNSDDLGKTSSTSRLLLKADIHADLLPKFISGVFEVVADTFYKNGGSGLKAQFGDVSLLADGCGGRFSLTLEREQAGGQVSRIVFGTCTEAPFNHFINPTLSSYYGRAADWNQMIEEVAQGLRIAREEGRQVLQPHGALAAMFGG